MKELEYNEDTHAIESFSRNDRWQKRMKILCLDDLRKCKGDGPGHWFRINNVMHKAIYISEKEFIRCKQCLALMEIKEIIK